MQNSSDDAQLLDERANFFGDLLLRRKTLWRRIIPDTCHWVGHNRHQIYATAVLDFLGNILYMVVIAMPLSIWTLLIFHKI
ncbi:unnamed protein product [Sphagnum troendelagicum]|uniref:Uncharacterized protein n=1 Tax=Sphagnum troendelagicum TaxID=128251 RepID=A0ABP0TTY7_9BRYO